MLTNKKSLPRIIYVTYTVPWNPRYGGAIRCYGVIEGLARSSELHVVFAGSNPAEIDSFINGKAPIELTRHVLKPNQGWQETDDWRSSRNFKAVIGRGKFSRAFQELVFSLNPDILWFFEVEALRRTSMPRDVPVVLDHCDVRWRKQQRVAELETGLERGRGTIKSALTRLDDTLLALRVRQSLVASPDEIALLWPSHSVSVLPNGFHFPTNALTFPQFHAHTVKAT